MPENTEPRKELARNDLELSPASEPSRPPAIGSRLWERFRIGFPIALVALWLVLGSVCWFLTPYPRDFRLVGVVLLSAGMAALLATWAILFTRWRWVVAGTLLVTGLFLYGTVREVRLKGDTDVIVIFVWDVDDQEHLAEFLRAESSKSSTSSVTHSGEESGVKDPVSPAEATKETVANRPSATEETATGSATGTVGRGRAPFPRYRGPEANGIVPPPEEGRLATDWEHSPPKLLWRRPVGAGYAGIAVDQDRLVTIEQRGNEEVVVAYDRRTGRPLWTHAEPAHFQESMGGPGPRSTPTLDEAGDVYALGATGSLVRLDGQTGSLRWRRNILEDAETKNLEWGMAGSPLLVDSLVVVQPGGTDGKSVSAYDRDSGNVVWQAGTDRGAYTSPLLGTFSGKRQILALGGTELAAFDLETGHRLWGTPFTTLNGVNIPQPILLGSDQLLLSAGYHKGCLAMRVVPEGSQWGVEPVWPGTSDKKTSLAISPKMSSPILKDGTVYALSDNFLVAMDVADGRRLWKAGRAGRYGHGQILLSGDQLVVMGENGTIALVAANPEGFQEWTRFMPFVAPFDGKCWNPHAVAGRELFVRNHQQLSAWELPVAPTGP